MRDPGPSLRGYRRITPLGMSTLLWLNSDGRKSGQGSSRAGDLRADAEQADAKPRIHAAVLDAAQAVERHYTERKARSKR